MGNYFFYFFAATVLVIRVFLFIRPIAAPTIGKFRIHHYMYGVAGIFAGLMIHSVTIYAIGWALFLDELTFLLTGGKTPKDNYSKLSLIGTLLFALLVFMLKGYLASPFAK